ncbi:hypothetical protein ACLI4Y_19750 [Natrialbaceae archaeon A-CW3]
MNRELALVCGAIVVLIASMSTLALAGGVSGPDAPEPDIGDDQQGVASISEVTIATDDVTGGTAVLSLETHLDHHGDTVENVTVVHRATDTETGFLVQTTEREVDPLESESEYQVSGTVALPRESEYRIETIVYVDGTRTETVSQTVSGIDSLTPSYADTDLEFHRFTGAGGAHFTDIPSTEHTVVSTDDDRATLEVTSYLTNTGDDSEDDLRLTVTARQADSNIVADSTSVHMDAVGPGDTATPEGTLDVPAEYDYYLDAMLWRGETIVATDRAVANLAGGNLTVDESETVGGLEVSDFETTSNDNVEFDDDTESDDADMDDDGQPGFGVLAGLGAVLLAISFARRYTHD